MTLPWDINEAGEAHANVEAAQAAHAENVREAVKAAARADQLYRVALARREAELRDEGRPAALCRDLARGDAEVAQLAYESQVAEGDREVAVQEGWRLQANRRATEQLVDWSKRRELAEGLGQVPEPKEMQTFGRRAA